MVSILSTDLRSHSSTYKNLEPTTSNAQITLVLSLKQGKTVSYQNLRDHRVVQCCNSSVMQVGVWPVESSKCDHIDLELDSEFDEDTKCVNIFHLILRYSGPILRSEGTHSIIGYHLHSSDKIYKIRYYLLSVSGEAYIRKQNRIQDRTLGHTTRQSCTGECIVNNIN